MDAFHGPGRGGLEPRRRGLLALVGRGAGRAVGRLPRGPGRAGDLRRGRRSPKAQAGDEVSAGTLLGLIDTGLAKVEVKSPSAGKLLAGAAEDGKPVEFGQPLFFIQPR
ncbi:MAG: hypothetical protein HYV15_00495 [Elusimicrobia bacterium]|nr:hypothetical protein [Elusimicrobiota bacterium]